MRILLNQLLELTPDPWDAVLVIGARPEGSLDLLRSLRAQRLLLAQAQPEQARMLDGFIDPARGEEVLATAVATPREGDPVKLRVCNIPRFNALSAPTGLAKLLPNVSVVDEIDVPIRSLPSVAQEAGLVASNRNLLIVDAPGQWSGLIEEPAALALFSSIIAVAAEEPLYAGGGALTDVLDHLHGAGFEDVVSDPEAIYPLVTRMLRRNDARIELQELNMQLRRLARERDSKAARLDELEVKLAQLLEKEKELAVLTADRDRAVGTVAEQAMRVGELEKELASLMVERDNAAGAAAEQGKQVGELEKELAALMVERDNAAGVAAEQGKHVGELEKDLAALTVERDKTAENAEERLKQIGGLKERIGKLERDLAASGDSASLAIRLQTLRENDLEDLRKRYATLHDAHQAQRTLLAKLSERLVTANRYFQQLAASDALEMREATGIGASRAAALIGEEGAAGRSTPASDPAKGARRSPARKGNPRKSGSGKQ